MNHNIKALKISIIAITVTLVSCLGISYYITLDEPVFFPNYSEFVIYYDGSAEESFHRQDLFQLQYVTNITDKRTVTGIVFPEAPELNLQGSNYMKNLGFAVFSNDNSQMIGTTYGRYSVRTIFVGLTYVRGEEPFSDFLLTKAKIYYNTGEIQEVDLGKIILRSKKYELGYLDGKSSSSSSNGYSSEILNAHKDITLMKVDSPLLKDVAGLFELTIDGIDYTKISGLERKQGSAIKVEALFETPKDKTYLYNTYHFLPDIYYKDKDENIFTRNIYNISYLPYYSNPYSFTGLIKYLHSKEVI